jgi:hypothetical protein
MYVLLSSVIVITIMITIITTAALTYWTPQQAGFWGKHFVYLTSLSLNDSMTSSLFYVMLYMKKCQVREIK